MMTMMGGLDDAKNGDSILYRPQGEENTGRGYEEYASHGDYEDTGVGYGGQEYPSYSGPGSQGSSGYGTSVGGGDYEGEKWNRTWKRRRI